MTDLFSDLDVLRAKAVELPGHKPKKLKRPEEPPVEPALIDPSTVDPVKLHVVGRCRQCGQQQWSFEKTRCHICCLCAASQIIRDPQKHYPDDVWSQAQQLARHSSAEQIVWRLGIERSTAIKFRWKMLGYDANADFSACYDLACAEMRKK